jgi:hypothetical protein
MRFLCTHCDQKLHTGHYWQGLSVTCPSCGKSTELHYREGYEIPNTEYSISFSEFKSLITYEPYSDNVDSIVKNMLNCSIQRTKTEVKLVVEDGSLIPLEAAHLEIQLNNGSQRNIYNAAMSRWH